MRFGKIAVLIFLLFAATKASAQRKMINMSEHDDKLYYFGITFGLNYSVHQIKYTADFAANDTFMRIQPNWRPGFNLGLIGNLRLNRFMDLRFVPSLAFADKNLVFQYGPPEDSISNRSIESIYIHLPVQVKFKSDRINNFRFYGLTGGKFDFDLASNARSRRRDEFLKVRSFDFGYELGFGFEFYNPNFIFSPEIKISQGLGNQLFVDPNLPLSNAIQSLRTRMIVISIHLEG